MLYFGVKSFLKMCPCKVCDIFHGYDSKNFTFHATQKAQYGEDHALMIEKETDFMSSDSSVSGQCQLQR